MKRISKWKALFSTQFLGVLNDNLLKNVIIFSVGIFWLSDTDKEWVIAVASALLVFPFVLFSPLAGILSQRFSKSKVLTYAKFVEVFIMLLASIALFIDNFYLMLTAMLFMGFQSAIYAPSKYGMIKEIEGERGLSFGNGGMELLTFSGVLLGQFIAGILIDLPLELFHIKLLLSILFLLNAVLGWRMSAKVKEVLPTDKNVSFRKAEPVSFLVNVLKKHKKKEGVVLTMLGLCGFWTVAALLQMVIYVYVPEQFGLKNTGAAFVMGIVAVGIGLGCWFAGVLSKNKIELGWISLGSLGLSICVTLLVSFNLNLVLFSIVLFLAAFSSGFYKVPLNAWLQHRVSRSDLGEVLAANQMLVFLFILLSSGIFTVVINSFGAKGVLVLTAVFSWCITVITYRKTLSQVLRLIAKIFLKGYYKIKISGLDKIPQEGGALLVVNHVSYIDALLIGISVPREVSFIMDRDWYYHKALHWLMKRLNVIPVPGKRSKKALEEFNEICRAEVEKGNVLVIFPEGKVSRTGKMNEFKKGVEHISKKLKEPIIPISLGNVVSTPFAFSPKTQKLILPKLKYFRQEIYVSIGDAFEQNTSALKMMETVQLMLNEHKNATCFS